MHPLQQMFWLLWKEARFLGLWESWGWAVRRPHFSLATSPSYNQQYESLSLSQDCGKTRVHLLYHY